MMIEASYCIVVHCSAFQLNFKIPSQNFQLEHPLKSNFQLE